jgi:hypothetical protein
MSRHIGVCNDFVALANNAGVCYLELKDSSGNSFTNLNGGNPIGAGAGAWVEVFHNGLGLIAGGQITYDAADLDGTPLADKFSLFWNADTGGTNLHGDYPDNDSKVYLAINYSPNGADDFANAKFDGDSICVQWARG